MCVVHQIHISGFAGVCVYVWSMHQSHTHHAGGLNEINNLVFDQSLC